MTIYYVLQGLHCSAYVSFGFIASRFLSWAFYGG